MSKTLTPQLRFKGFEDEWKTNILSDICSFSRGQGYSKSDLKNNGNPIFYTVDYILSIKLL